MPHPRTHAIKEQLVLKVMLMDDVVHQTESDELLADPDCIIAGCSLSLSGSAGERGGQAPPSSPLQSASRPAVLR